MATTALEVMPPPQRHTLEPNTLAEAKEFAELASKSDLVPKDYKGNAFNVLIAIQFGKELGVQPMQALQGIAVINGRPSVWGDLMLAIVMAHPDFEDIEEDDLADIKANNKAVCIVHRRGRKPVKRTFSMEDAKLAKLWDKDGPWKNYPSRMMQMRARGFAVRDAFPDAMRGLVSAEEAGDYDGPTIEGPYHSIAELPPIDNPITQDQARDFSKAWKVAGKTLDQVKAYLKEQLDTDSSLKIKTSQYEKALAWAKGTAAATNQPRADEKPHPDKAICFELFKILGYDDVKQAKAIQEHASNWTALAAALNKELPEEK
jgi:hypothetical protein